MAGLFSAGVLADDARAEAGAADSIVTRSTWSFHASAYTYIVPDDQDYLQPSILADRGSLHLEARYNYEELKTGSFWIGYNANVGEDLFWSSRRCWAASLEKSAPSFPLTGAR